jgi:ribonuclease P protein component
MRLRRQGELDAVFRGGVRVHGDVVSVIGRIVPEGFRIGILCGKRFSKRAVDRNRFRRIVRETARRASFEVQGGLELVVLPRCRPEQLSGAAVERELPRLVDRLMRKLAPKPNPPAAPCSDPS